MPLHRLKISLTYNLIISFGAVLQQSVHIEAMAESEGYASDAPPAAEVDMSTLKSSTLDALDDEQDHNGRLALA